MIADVTPSARRAASYGLPGVACGVGFIVGPALGGVVAVPGPRAPFVVAAGPAAMNALAMACWLPETLAPAHRRPFRRREALVGTLMAVAMAIVAWLLPAGVPARPSATAPADTDAPLAGLE